MAMRLMKMQEVNLHRLKVKAPTLSWGFFYCYYKINRQSVSEQERNGCIGNRCIDAVYFDFVISNRIYK
jgi:hypothetical protein